MSWKAPDADLAHNITPTGGPKQTAQSLTSSWLHSLFYRHLTVIIVKVILVLFYYYQVKGKGKAAP